MQRIKEEVGKLYEDLKGVLYRVNHLQDEFDNNCFTKTLLERKTKKIVNKKVKSLLGNCCTTVETLSNISSAEDEDDLREILDQIKALKLVNE